jgi:hypothetical protein
MRFPRRRADGSGPARAPRPNGRIGLGLVLIGTGRTAGFAQFGATTEAFLSSLAPLLGVLFVLGGVVAWYGQPMKGAAAVLTGVCDLLAPAVIADLFCRRWARRQHWALYANVLNCAQWLMLAALVLLVPLASFGLAAGLSMQAASLLTMVPFGLYVLWFHWFAARHVLDLSRGRAALVMACVVFGTGLLLQAPPLLAGEPPGDNPPAVADPGH